VSGASAKRAVRVPLRRRPQPRRTREEKAALRFPRTVGLARRAALALPVGFRLRSEALRRATAIAFASYERGDFETVPRIFYSDEVVLETGRNQESPLDLPSPVHGIEGVIRWLRVWHEAFSEIHWEPRELYDGGDRLVFVVEQVATGRASGAEVRHLSASAVWIERGLVVRQLATWELTEAMEAAGLTFEERT
jgi:ketosteroid isomerase-like protein